MRRGGDKSDPLTGFGGAYRSGGPDGIGARYVRIPGGTGVVRIEPLTACDCPGDCEGYRWRVMCGVCGKADVIGLSEIADAVGLAGIWGREHGCGLPYRFPVEREEQR